MMLHRLSLIILTVGAILPSAIEAHDRKAAGSALAAAEETYERKLLAAELKSLQEQIAARTAYRAAVAEAKLAALESGDLKLVRRFAELEEKVQGELDADRKAFERIEHELAGNAGVVVRGKGFVLKVLRNEATAYSNRIYKWHNVPEKLQGWRYTQIDGGDTPDFRIEALDDGVVYVMAESSKLVEHGWTPRPKLGFRWISDKSAMMLVFSKKVEAGEVVKVPHFGWTGTLVLTPPNAASKEVAEMTIKMTER